MLPGSNPLAYLLYALNLYRVHESCPAAARAARAIKAIMLPRGLKMVSFGSRSRSVCPGIAAAGGS